MHEQTSFLPDWASPPGATINEMIKARGWSISEFAKNIRITEGQTTKLIGGRAEITNELASQLSSVFGLSATFWMSRESQYRAALIRLAENEQWMKTLPVKDMTKFGWVPDVANVQAKVAACLAYFGVPTVRDWYEQYNSGQRLAAFRTSTVFESAEAAVLAWLRRGEIEAGRIDCAKWNRTDFESRLPEIRALTRIKNPAEFIPQLVQICASCGVAVVIARAPSRCRASGATRFLGPDKALLMLSGRGLRDDMFWFTFFHEAGHLVLHDTRSLFLEGGELCTGDEEREADAYAAGQLVPAEYRDEMLSLPHDGRVIVRFARKVGVSPGIIVGQLRHAGVVKYGAFENLRVRYTWDDE